GRRSQQTPVNWIMSEPPQLATSRLIPVKSSNNMASKILKTLTDTQHVEANSANILPVSSSGAGGSQTKITPLKDNALVMYNGKVYFLTRKGFDVLSVQGEKQAPSSSGASLKKETPKLINSTAVDKITSKVLNLVLSKSKGIMLVQKDPKPCVDSAAATPCSLKIGVKPGPAAPSPRADQQDTAAEQRKSLPLPESVSSGVTPPAAVETQENMCQNDREELPSPPAASVVCPQPEQEPVLGDDRQKVADGALTVALFQTPCEKMESPAKVIQAKPPEKPHWKQHLELRRKFGLHKEERVYLKRIPLSTHCEAAGEWVSSSTSVRKESNSSSEDWEEDVTKKRKIKSSSLSDSGKRRKTSVKSSTSPSSENPTSDVVVPSVWEVPEQEPCTLRSNLTGSSIPISLSSEDDTSVLEDSLSDDALPLTPPDLDETIRDEKIKRLKQLLRQREAALEEVRRK
ncbi:Ligand-dependent nuclear receptor-interacting factor 1, partial [Buceros rhinoceros silvestris]